jgi:hypothetical protein
MIEFASPTSSQRHLFPTLVLRQPRRRSADEAPSVYRGQDCDEAFSSFFFREGFARSISQEHMLAKPRRWA